MSTRTTTPRKDVKAELERARELAAELQNRLVATRGRKGEHRLALAQALVNQVLDLIDEELSSEGIAA